MTPRYRDTMNDHIEAWFYPMLPAVPRIFLHRKRGRVNGESLMLSKCAQDRVTQPVCQWNQGINAMLEIPSASVIVSIIV